jgi:hypothetical protein
MPVDDRQSSASGSWLAKLGALAVSLVVVLLAIEIGIRATGRDAALVWKPDPKVGWWHIPHAKSHWTVEGDGWVEINSLRLRDAERALAKPAGVYRIGVFGDSMTEGVQVNLEQTFTQLLERSFRARGLDVEVLNFGVNGYSALQGYLLYEHHGVDFDLDLVIHAVFTDNDVADGDPELATGQYGAPIATLDASGGLQVDYAPAEASSARYHGQPVHAIRRLSAAYRMFSTMRAGQRADGRFETGRRVTGGVPRRYMLYADPLEPRWEAAWRILEAVLDTFSRKVREAGAVFLVLDVPAGQVVDAEAWKQVLATHPAMTAGRWQLLDPTLRLSDIGARHELRILRPLDYFKEHHGAGPLFFGSVGHLTPRGHEVMASFLERALEELGFPNIDRGHQGRAEPPG